MAVIDRLEGPTPAGAFYMTTAGISSETINSTRVGCAMAGDPTASPLGIEHDSAGGRPFAGLVFFLCLQTGLIGGLSLFFWLAGLLFYVWFFFFACAFGFFFLFFVSFSCFFAFFLLVVLAGLCYVCCAVVGFLFAFCDLCIFWGVLFLCCCC